MDNFDPIHIDFNINAPEVKKDASKVKNDIRGIGKEADNVSSKLNKQMGNLYKNAPQNINKTTAQLAKQNHQFNNLNNSIAQITRELPAFTFSAQTGFLAISNNIPILADEISRMRAQNDALTASGKKGVPVWKQVSKGIFSWNTALSVGVTLLTVYGPQIARFFKEMFSGKKAITDVAAAQKALNKAYESTSFQKAVRGVVAVRAAFAGAGTDIDKRRQSLKLYNETLGKALGTANNYNEAEKLFRDKSDAYVKALLFRAAATEAVNEASKELLRLTKEEDETNEKINAKGGTRSATSTFATKNLRKEKRAIQKESKEIETVYNRLINSLNGKADKLKAAFGLNFDDDGKNKPSKVLAERKRLLERIADLDREYARKKLDDDAAEVQALKDKFGKIRKLVEDFNADPKTKVNQRIDLTAFDQLETNAVKDLDYEQQTNQLKDEIQRQKRLFTEFEEYKKTFGVAKAKERYAALLAEYDNYGAFLQKKYAENQEAVYAFTDGDATGSQSRRAQLLIKSAEVEQRAQLQSYDKILAQLLDYESNRAKVIEEYNTIRLRLLADGRTAEETELTRQFNAQLDELDIANAKSTDAYRELVLGVENLTIKAARTVTENAQKMVDSLVKAGKLSKNAAQEIRNEIGNVNAEINNKQDIKFQNIANAFGNIGNALSQAGDDIAAAVGNMVVELSGAFSVLADSNASGLQKASGLVGLIIQAGGLMNQIGENKLNKVVNEQKRLNQGIEEQLIMEAKINELRRERAAIERNSSAFLDSYYKDDFSAALKQQIDSELQLQEAMDLLSKNGIFSASGTGKRLLFGSKTENRDFSIEQILGDFQSNAGYYQNWEAWVFDPLSIFGGYSDTNVSKDALKNIRKSFDEALEAMGKTAADMAQFSAGEWLDFFTLMDEAGHVTDKATKKMLENAQAAAEEYKKAMEEMKKIISDFAGQLGNDLGNALVEAFRTGENAAEGFKKSLNNILTNLFLQDIINSQFRTFFDDLQKEMTESMGLDGDQSWVDDVIRFGDAINPAIQQALEAMGIFDEQLKNLGYDGFAGGDINSGSGLQGAIRRELTEETGSELTGLFRGQYDITKRHYFLAEKHFELEERHYNSTVSIMQNTAKIEQNTRDTVETLTLAVVELQAINKNTKTTSSARNIGKGTG